MKAIAPPVEKLVVLKLDGDFQRGFHVTLEIGLEGDRPSIEISGMLPAAPELAIRLNQWHHLYRSLGMVSRIQPQQIIYGGSVNRLEECHQLANGLQHHMAIWLESPLFHRLDKRLREALSPNDLIRILIRTEDLQLRRLPWHLWDLVERYPKAEVALSAPMYEQIEVKQTIPRQQSVKILAILGNSAGINVEQDRHFLNELPDAEVAFLVEPERQQMNQQLWAQPWDILFFAGHSTTEGDRGRIYLNAEESLTLEELRYGLRRAIAQGLQLAIFNSCDGLGLAYELEQLHLPQMIVMREPVPDRVAQEFLKHLLTAFTEGKPLYVSVREARERLQGIENQFPCATWLPVICQNPAKRPPTWQALIGAETASEESGVHFPRLLAFIAQFITQFTNQFTTEIVRSHLSSITFRSTRRFRNLLRNLRFFLLITLIVTIGLTGIRYLGWLEPWEIGTYDYMMRLRPDEGFDPRLLIVEITDADITTQQQNGELLQRRSLSAQSLNELVDISLSDTSLDRLLSKLEQYKPRVIGLDIYRDFAVEPNQTGLAHRLSNMPGLIGVCKAEDFYDPEILSIDPPPEIPAEQIGFSDFREDRDGILRRHLLGMLPLLWNQTSQCHANRAFSVQIAAHYLSQHNIETRFTDEGDLQIGNQVFKILRSRSGGYETLDAAGSEILLNYRATDEIAPRVTLDEILNNRISPEYVEDKIVLIGVTASDGEDIWLTPTHPHIMMPGVLVQAHMVSQLVSAALDQRPILQVLPRWQESVWIFVWATIGGVLAGWTLRNRTGLRSFFFLSATVILVSILLYGVSYLELLKGIWIPFVPPFLSLILSGIAGFCCFFLKRKFHKSSHSSEL